MKRFILVVIYLVFGNSYFSQDYIPFPDSVATWNFYNYSYNGEEDNYQGLKGLLYHIEGDTTVAGYDYSKLYVSQSYNYNNMNNTYSNTGIFYTLVGGIREDSTKKVWYKNFNFDNWDDNPWFIPENGSFTHHYYLPAFHLGTNQPMTNILTDSTELMLYDFGMEVGDSIQFYGDIQSEISYWSFLEEITIDILGRRNFIFSFPEENSLNFSRVWIDGIGDSKADLFSLYNIVSWEGFGIGGETRLTCFWQDGEQVYTPETYVGSENLTLDCLSLVVGLKELNIEIQRLNIYPNPSSGRFVIELPALRQAQEPVFVRVFNAFGEEVFSQVDLFGESIEIDLSSFPSGIYMAQLQLIEQNAALSTGSGTYGSVYSSKIIKE